MANTKIKTSNLPEVDNRLVEAMDHFSDRSAGIISGAAKTYAESAQNFVRLAPVQRVTYFGFALTVFAVISASFSAFGSFVRYSETMSIAMLIAGIIVILIGALGEALVSIHMSKQSAEAARSLEAEAALEREKGRASIMSIFKS